MTNLMTDGDERAPFLLLLAHGAGAGMESPFMAQITEQLVERGIRVTRFQFGYMAPKGSGKGRPPPRAELLCEEYERVVARIRASLGANQRLLIGGKSMGGRVASMLADKLHTAGTAAGLVCLGYPFHPQGQPEVLRVQHLERLACPALIVQGERDPFGARDLVEPLIASGALSDKITLAWAGDGDHDLGPRGGKGFTRRGNLAAAADAVAAFAARLA